MPSDISSIGHAPAHAAQDGTQLSVEYRTSLLAIRNTAFDPLSFLRKANAGG
jgi:hypothetical protein